MKRRTLLQLGLAGSVAVGLAGLAATQWESPLRQGRLSATARDIFASVGAAILDGCLPSEPAARTAAIGAMIDRVERVIAGLPGATQDELAELLGILSTGPGRVGVFGLWSGWRETGTASMGTHLQALRVSALAMRRQVYQAFHEIVNGAYFADDKTWALLGYAGPVDL